MNDLYTLKHSDLFLEFTRYITTHPKFSEQIPDGAEVILLDSHDKGYTRFMLKHAPKKDAISFSLMSANLLPFARA